MASAADSSAVDEAPNEKHEWPTAEDRIVDATETVTKGETGLKDDETKERKRNKYSPFVFFVINGFATVVVFAFHLISLESLLSIGLSVGLTVYTYNVTEENASWDGGIMDWILLSFAIVTPMSSSIGMAYTRRENALQHMVTIRSLFFGLYQAHSTWDWGTKPVTGRAKSSVDWLTHSDSVLKDIFGIADDLTRYLTLPSTTRARHRVLPFARRQAVDMKILSDKLIKTLQTRMNRISLHCEILKMEGLPGNEAARMRQWERDIVDRVERLQVIKEYRTPQALRSLCRIFTVLLPPYYAPFYAQMARDLDSLAMGIVFSILTSLILTALFESLVTLEDPFVARVTLDGIDVPRELQEAQQDRLLNQRNNVYFPNNEKPFKAHSSPSEGALPRLLRDS